MRLPLAVVLLLVFAVPARAETDKLARGMELRVPDHAREVELVRGNVHVTLYGESAHDMIVGVLVTVDRKHEQVTLGFDGNCGGGDTQHYTYDELEAMLEAEAAGKLLRAKDAHGAALGYAKAVALDPKDLADQEQLAIALMRDGQRRPEAAAALRGAMHDHPLAILTLIRREADLAPLASEPEMVALTAGAPGTFTRSAEVGYEPVHGWITVLQRSGSSMAEGVDGSGLDILAPTGALIVGAGDALVTQLGFDAALDGGGGHVRDDNDPTEPAPATSAHVDWSARLAQSGVSVICSDKGVLRVLAKNQILAEDEHASCGAGLSGSRGVYLVPHAIVSVHTISIGDGCGGEWYTEFHVTPLTKPGPPAMQALEAAAQAEQAARAGKLGDAIAGYTHAQALAPDRLDVGRRLAAVLARNHQVPEAIAALARLTPADRLFTIDVNPELAALAGAPEVIALHAAKPGTVHDFTGYQATAHLVSFRVDRQSYGSEKTSAVQIVDQRTGKLVTELPLVIADDIDHDGCDVSKSACLKKTSGPILKARAAAVHQVLTEMGFDAPIEKLTAKAQPAGTAVAWRATSRSKQFEIACSTDSDLSITSGKTVSAKLGNCDLGDKQVFTRFAGFVLMPASTSDAHGGEIATQVIVPYR